MCHDPYVGRYLRACRDIAPLETVFTDIPAVVAPQSKPLCLRCLREVDPEGNAQTCKGGCGMLMCGEDGCDGVMDEEGKWY